MLVVPQRPGELYLHTLFVVTSSSPAAFRARDLLDRYRARDTTETHIGEHQSLIRRALSSAGRPEGDPEHRKVQERAELIDARPANTAALPLHEIAYDPITTLQLLGGTAGT